MKLIWGLLLGAIISVVPAKADNISYSLSVENAPGDIGNVSWDIVTNGFIAYPLICPARQTCTGSAYTGIYNSFLEVSAPSNGDGCGITGVFAVPGYAFTTFFSPLCDGGYDSLTAGVVEQPGQLGTWTFTGTNPDDTQNVVTWTVTDLTAADDSPSDPVGTPEPGTLALLSLGLLALGSPSVLQTLRR